MKKRLLVCGLAMLLSCVVSAAQQAKMEPLTFWYEYTVNPGKEADFMELVKTVGQPVRDQLMADGVVLAWGVQVPLLRIPGEATHTIWYAVADWSGIDKVDSAMRAQIAKLSDEGSKAVAGKKGQKPAGSVMDRLREDVDMSKTRDFLTRDIEFTVTTEKAPADALPVSRFNFVKVKPGKAAEFRKAWQKYNKPVLDKLLADGVIFAYGLAVEDIKTVADVTHFTWFDTKDLGSLEKVRTAFVADRERRSPEEQEAIVHLLTSLVEPDASRSEVARSILFHVGGPK